MRAMLLSVGLPFVAGCYAYDSNHLANPAPGTAVEAQLTGDGTAAMTRLLGPNVIAVQGHVLETTGTDLRLSLHSVTVRNQDRAAWKGEQVRIPISAIARVQQRRFSIARSLMMGGAAIGALVAAGVAFEGDGSATAASSPGSGPSTK